MFLHDLQFMISINLESMFFLWYTVFWPIKVVNNTVMGAKIHMMLWLPNMQDLKLFTLCGHTLWGSDSKRVSAVFTPKVVLPTAPGNPPAVRVQTTKPSNNQTRCIMAGRTQTRTHKPAGFAVFGHTRQFQSAVQCFQGIYLWSHLDVPLQISASNRSR